MPDQDELPEADQPEDDAAWLEHVTREALTILEVPAESPKVEDGKERVRGAVEAAVDPTQLHTPQGAGETEPAPPEWTALCSKWADNPVRTIDEGRAANIPEVHIQRFGLAHVLAKLHVGDFRTIALFMENKDIGTPKQREHFKRLAEEKKMRDEAGEAEVELPILDLPVNATVFDFFKLWNALSQRERTAVTDLLFERGFDKPFQKLTALKEAQEAHTTLLSSISDDTEFFDALGVFW